MPIITADMIHIRKNDMPFIYTKTFDVINRAFYNKYINDNDDEGYTMQIHTYYQGLPNWMTILFIEKILLDTMTTYIILDTDRKELIQFVEFYHSLYNHILEKVEYDESLLQQPDVYDAATKYVKEEYAKYTSITKNSIYTSVLDLTHNSVKKYVYCDHDNILKDLYERKRSSMKLFNEDASKLKLLKQIFAECKLPTSTLQQYNDWLSTEKGLDILYRWTLNRYELMTVYANYIAKPSLNLDKFIRNNCAAARYNHDNDDDNDSYNSYDDDDDSNKIIEDEEVANFNINI